MEKARVATLVAVLVGLGVLLGGVFALVHYDRCGEIPAPLYCGISDPPEGYRAGH